jgi:hypothetical protein
MSVNGMRGSLSLRAVLTIGIVLAGYLFLHAQFARLDSAFVGGLLSAVGFDVSHPERARLLVSAGDTYDVYAVVTGACSSAAGALGLAAAALVLLPGPLGRRALGAALAVALFVALNVLRIFGILTFGWVFATVPSELLLIGLSAAILVCVLFAWRLHGSLVIRASLVLGGVVLGVLWYDVLRGYHYSIVIGTYHALAGPLLTFSSLALSLLVLWRVIVGPRSVTAAA